MIARTPVLLALLAFTIAGCAQRANGPSMSSPANGVQFAGTRLVLAAYLNRDFMPILPPEDVNGRPLAAVLRVTTAESGPLPSGLTLEAAVVRFGSEVWQSQPEAVPTNDPALLMGRSRNGPMWGPGVTVDVEVTVRHGSESVVLHAPAVLIERSD